jgi:hypothetical protein
MVFVWSILGICTLGNNMIIVWKGFKWIDGEKKYFGRGVDVDEELMKKDPIDITLCACNLLLVDVRREEETNGKFASVVFKLGEES